MTAGSHIVVRAELINQERKMTEKTETPSNEMDLSGLVVPMNMETLFGMNQKIYKTMMACNDELMSFGRARLKEDLDIPQKLANCKSPQDVMGVYVSFYQEAVKQYTHEAGNLTKICSDLATVHAEDAKQAAK
ncbi:MAG: hypothetical protein CMN56_11470 [Sneathiella sp.]|nr:hypothetical protein [Sneathiella sp.]